MNYIKITKRKIDLGDIFAIPLFLPCQKLFIS